MNKVTTIGITVLSISLLAGCGNNSNKKAAVSKRNSSSLIAKKKAESESRAKESSKKASARKASSESRAKESSKNLAKAESESKASSESVAISSSKASLSVSSSASSEPTTLSDFVNKYGESPAAYKMDHDGMTGKQALAATPDNMETFGELQTEHPSKTVQESSSSSSSSYSPSDDPNSQENKAAHAKGGMLYGAPKNYTTAKWSSEEEAPNIKWRAEHGYSD